MGLTIDSATVFSDSNDIVNMADDPGFSFMTDQEGRDIAIVIMRDRPQWLIVYGVYSREYWAYALFSMTRRIVVHAAYPDALIDRIDRTERNYRIWPDEKDRDQ